jgi:3-dehydroquinate dehydratase
MDIENKTLTDGKVKSMIFQLRGLQVMIDRDLAELFSVTTKRLNEQVKRNLNRFPTNFRFQLSDNEKAELVANCDRFQRLKYSNVNPYAFTEQGVAMLSAVLHSEKAIEVSIMIMETFVDMRRFIVNNTALFKRIDNVEQKQIESEKQIEKLFKAFENNKLQPNEGIFYDGQIFDAYTFVSKLIKSANKSILLIDNYIDETTLLILSKRSKNVSTKIYTSKITEQLKLDLEKHNSQYPKIAINIYKKSHDRFIIIDNKDLYHIGASLKDLGKKWFAFSKIEIDVNEIIDKLRK